MFRVAINPVGDRPRAGDLDPTGTRSVWPKIKSWILKLPVVGHQEPQANNWPFERWPSGPGAPWPLRGMVLVSCGVGGMPGQHSLESAVRSVLCRFNLLHCSLFWCHAWNLTSSQLHLWDAFSCSFVFCFVPLLTGLWHGFFVHLTCGFSILTLWPVTFLPHPSSSLFFPPESWALWALGLLSLPGKKKKTSKTKLLCKIPFTNTVFF